MKRVKRAVIEALALPALLFNLAILISVTLDLDWVRTRAAGGQFDQFPIAIRVIYLVMALGTIYLIWFLWRLRDRLFLANHRRLVRGLGILFVLSTFTQLISRSADERFNAIPAAIIAIAFLRASRSLKQAS